MYWIRVLATTPAPVKAAPAPKPAAPPALAAETREKARAAAAQTPATTTPTSPNVAPAPKAVAHASKPAPASVGNVSEPSALSSGDADSAAAAVAAAESAPPLDVTSSPPAEPDPGLIQIKSVQPEFPTSVVERIRKGHVEVRFEVEPGGTVVDATVVATSHAHLNSAALDAVRQWRFKPTSASHTAQVDLVFNIANWN